MKMFPFSRATLSTEWLYFTVFNNDTHTQADVIAFRSMEAYRLIETYQRQPKIDSRVQSFTERTKNEYTMDASD